MRLKEGQRLDAVLLGIALLSAFLNTYNIWNNLYANAYYTSAVTSMAQSWHNFFYASFDPAGYVTVDKPPVTFWVQTIFACIFGVHGWSVILPQALAGVGSVLLMYKLVEPTFGKTAARLASLVMASTPVAVAVSRTNNIDSLLVFTLLLATWMLFRAMREQKLSWFLGALAMIGVGFNIKMLQAYMVVPAFYAFYLLAFKKSWKKKLAIFAAATAVMVGISLSWAIAVDLVPEVNRPYIGGSQTNSVLELALGYNGLSRLTGMDRGGRPGQGSGSMPNQRDDQRDWGTMPGLQQIQDYENNLPNLKQMTQNGNVPIRQEPGPGFDAGGPPGRGGGGMFGTGQAGLFRLFENELSGQASWLLPFVTLACFCLLSGIGRRKPLTAKQNEVLFWLAWLLPVMVFFSVAGFFHQYYLIMLAPPIAALAGAGWVELWDKYHNQEGWKTWLLPVGLLATTVFEVYVLLPYQKQIGLMWPIGIGATGIGLALVLFLAARKQKLSLVSAVAGMLILLAAPLYWSATPLLYGDNSMIPQAGPIQVRLGHKQGMGTGPNSNINLQLLEYVTQNNTGEKYLFATTDSNTAAPYIIETGKAIMAMGGFSGSDPILTVERLKQMVINKEVKYFLIPSGSGFGGGGRGGDSEVQDWIRANSTEVPLNDWQSSSTQDGPGRIENNRTLYQINE